MDNMDDSENNAKISDSAYSNSCSNSQSRRSHSSKSTHSGSNSSGSSGYGGKPSTSGSSNNNLGQQPKKEKESKKKKLPQAEAIATDVVVEAEVRAPEPAPDFDVPEQEACDVNPPPSPGHAQADGVESMDISTSDRNSVQEEVLGCAPPALSASACALRPAVSYCTDSFSCVISMHDGVVMYTTASLTAALGFPKDMWIGRSFIDFIHPRDRSTFASQITNGLAVPKVVNGTVEQVQSPVNSVSTLVCRMRRYRGLMSGFGVKDRSVTFMPFLLKLSFKNITDEEGKAIYLVIQATPFISAFKSPFEVVAKPAPFVIRHAANGNIEYVDPESVPYIGYLPQDLVEMNALLLYHPDDLGYLLQVYSTIVKEGALPKSKPYRMLTQNGDYLKLETEWSSFINPWSKKLEFVIGKHTIIEGPANPDVFYPSDPDKALKLNEKEKDTAQILRENIIRTMNDVPTKPAEIAKQQMTKRCQDLASFMESLMEDQQQPKTDEELRLDIQDPDHSYYERDSVMLGGISPHHEYNDSKSSTETPLSYNQLNYNDNLQRYFESQQPYSYEDYNTVSGENILGIKDLKPVTNQCLSPMAQNSGDSLEMTSSSDSNVQGVGNRSPMAPVGDYLPIRLTEFILAKHNAEMEKELMKQHRETRSVGKGEREKATNESRLKKKEHLARCNASYQPTTAGVAANESQGHGVKRGCRYSDADSHARKHHCTAARTTRRRQRNMSTSVAVAQPSSTLTTTVANHWPTGGVSNNTVNTFFLGVGIPQQMSLVSPVSAVPGMFPMYYTPAAASSGVSTTTPTSYPSSSAAPPQFQTAMPCMMYGQPMYGSHFMYSPIGTPVSYPVQQTMMAQTMHHTSAMNPLGLTSRNYEEACRPAVTMRPAKLGGTWRDKKRAESQATSLNTDHGSADSVTSTKALNRESGAHISQSGNGESPVYTSNTKSSSNSYCPKSTEAVPDTPPCQQPMVRDNKLVRLGNNSDETIDKTDGESSYSSFYSSFFKTESGSAEDSGDAKKDDGNKENRLVKNQKDGPSGYYEPQAVKKLAKRKMEPPWLEQVCVTSELVYKYQILTKSLDEVLTADKQKMSTMEQPSLVNEQLGQLYLDLQLEGVAARLTLEEGITSSSSSGEETASVSKKNSRRKREYSKLVMIYEEDAPLPPPTTDGEENEPEPEKIANA